MQPQANIANPLPRIRLWYALLVFISIIFVLRAFYLQVIRHDYYQKAALRGQLKEYEIPARRGMIEAHSGNAAVPIVLNEKRFNLFADPKYIKDPGKTARGIAGAIGGNSDDYEKKLRTPDTRYVILAKKLTKSQKEKIDQATDDQPNLWKGVGMREIEIRYYPEGQLAAQLLGFVNDEGEGKYGLEQALNKELTGMPGELRAITDASGVPLAANKDNLLIEPQAGKDVLLTIDVGMQSSLEDILKEGLDKAKSSSGSAVILDARNGAIKAMANYPTYNPAEYFKVEDSSLFNNPAVSAPLEVGSIMKPLTAAAALDLGVINRNSTFYDPGRYIIDGASVTNIEEHSGPGVKSVTDILQQSLNTGATWILMQMGGGEINQKARVTWHDYMVNHYRFGKLTGIEQGYEESGSIPDPIKGYGLNIQYANASFGQGMSATILQMGAALASVLNGGTYYQPHLVEKIVDADGKETIKQPRIVRQNVVKPSVSKDIQGLMEYVIQKNYLVYSMSKPRLEFSIGGKTGTAQIPKPEGGYYEDRYNGTFYGFVGGDKPQYVIVVRVNDPKIAGYAGSRAAAPIFGKLADMLINNFGVTPKT
jgi:cell division protein FtsI/penicillin-binding protein 2